MVWKGVCYILDFYKDTGELMCYEEFCNQYSFNPLYPLNPLYTMGFQQSKKKLNLFYNPKYIIINLSFYPKFL